MGPQLCLFLLDSLALHRRISHYQILWVGHPRFLNQRVTGDLVLVQVIVTLLLLLLLGTLFVVVIVLVAELHAARLLLLALLLFLILSVTIFVLAVIGLFPVFFRSLFALEISSLKIHKLLLHSLDLTFPCLLVILLLEVLHEARAAATLAPAASLVVTLVTHHELLNFVE